MSGNKPHIYLTCVIFILIPIVCCTPLSIPSDSSKQNGVLIQRKSEPPDSVKHSAAGVYNNDLLVNSALHDTISEFNGTIQFECEGRQPLYALRDSVKDQETRSPYIIKVEPSAVSAGQTVSVSIETIGGHAFRGMVLQVVPARENGEDDVMQGRFLKTPAINLQSCNGENNTAILWSPAALENLELQWTPSVGSSGDVIVVGTFVEDYLTFWADVRSNQITVNQDGQTSSKSGDNRENNSITDALEDVDEAGESTEDVLGHNGVIAVERLGSEIGGVFTNNGDTARDAGSFTTEDSQADADRNTNVLYSAMRKSPLKFEPPETAEFIGGILKAMSGGGGGGGGGGGLGSMFNMMQGLGTMSSLLKSRKSSSGGGGGLLGSLLGGGRSNAVAPPPSGLPPSRGPIVSGGANEPSLADLLGVDPSTVIDNSPAAVPARPKSSPLSALSGLLGGGGGGGGGSGGGGGGGIGSLLGNMGTISSLAKLMGGGSKSKQQAPSGMFGGGQPQLNQQNPMMQQLQMQQMQIAALQRQLGQSSVPNMMGGFGNNPIGFGQQTNAQLLGIPGQRQTTVPGMNTGMFGQSVNRLSTQTSGFGQLSAQQNGFNNRFGSNVGQTTQQFQTNGMLNNNMIQNANQFPGTPNNLRQTQTPVQNNQLLQELMRQNQLLMQQNQHLRTGNLQPNGQNLNNNNQGFQNGNGIGQNSNGFSNSVGQNMGLNNVGTNGANNFGPTPGTNSNTGISSVFGQNSNRNGNSGVSNGNNIGQNNNGFSNQNSGLNQNTNHINGHHGTGSIGIPNNSVINGQTRTNNFGNFNSGQNSNLNNGFSGSNNFGQNSNTVGQASNSNMFGANNNNGGNSQLNSGFGGTVQNGNAQGNNGFGGVNQNGNTFGGNSQNTGGFGVGGVNQNGNTFGGNSQNTGGFGGTSQNGNTFGGNNQGNGGFGNGNQNGNTLGANSNINPGLGGNQNNGGNTGGSSISQFGGSGGTLSGQLSGLLGGLGGSTGSSNNNNPLSSLMGSQGQGSSGLSSLMGNIDTSAIQGMLGQMGSGNGQGMPDISSLLGGIDQNAVAGLLQGEQGAGLMDSVNKLMNSNEGGGLMNAVQGMMSGDPNAMKSIESIMSGENGGDIFDMAEQARGLLSQSGIDPQDILASLGRK